MEAAADSERRPKPNLPNLLDVVRVGARVEGRLKDVAEETSFEENLKDKHVMKSPVLFPVRTLSFLPECLLLAFQKVFRFSLEINTSNPRSGNQLLQSDLLIPQIEVT